MGIKVAVVGGGSTYTPELVEGFVAPRRDRVPIDELVLLDIDRERLEVVGGLAQRMLDRLGWPGRLTLTADRDAAIDGADFVLIQLRVGRPGGPPRRRDAAPAVRRDRSGDDRRRAGFAKALRTVPVVLELAELTSRRAARPDAWIVDFTNPVGIVTQALLDDGHRAIGLCNVAIALQRRLAARFGVDARARRARARRAQPPDLGARRSGSTASDRLPDLLDAGRDELAGRVAPARSTCSRWIGAIPSYYLRYYYLPGRRARRAAATATRGRGGHATSSASCSRCTATRPWTEKPELLDRPRRRLLQRGARRSSSRRCTTAPATSRSSTCATTGPCPTCRTTRSSRCPPSSTATERTQSALAPLAPEQRGLVQARQGVRGARHRGGSDRRPPRRPAARWRPTRWWAARSPAHCSTRSSPPTAPPGALRSALTPRTVRTRNGQDPQRRVHGPMTIVVPESGVLRHA